MLDLVGFFAGSLVLATFCMRTMLWLRTIAIVSNIAFISYGVLAELTPIYVLHALLLPMNLMRFVEHIRSVQPGRHEVPPIVRRLTGMSARRPAPRSSRVEPWFMTDARQSHAIERTGLAGAQVIALSPRRCYASIRRCSATGTGPYRS